MNIAAAQSFGKFKESFLSELYAEIVSHAKQEAPGAPEPVKGITVHDSDMLEPEPVRPGGLMRKDAVCDAHRLISHHSLISPQRHAFKAPAKPLEPPTPRTSVLGLDRLAREKREAQADQDGSRKRPRTDDGFKGTFGITCCVHDVP